MLVKPALQAHAEKQIKQFHRTRGVSREKLVGASEVGLCLRRIKFAKVVTMPPEGWGATQRGTNFEMNYWVPAMRKHYGKNLLYSGSQQRSLIHGQLRATPDGLLIHQKRNALKDLGVDDIGPSGEIVLDCKTIDPRINLSTPKPEHEFQIQVQMALFNITTRHRPRYGVLSYVNASFFDDVVEFAVKYDPAVYEQARSRAAQVLKPKILPLDLPPEGWIAGGKECNWCPFAAPCQELRGEVPDAVTTIGNFEQGLLDRIAVLAREERRLDATASGIEETQRKIQHEIKELLRVHGLNRIAHDGITVVWSPVKGRPSFDMPALRAAAAKLGLDIQTFETVGQPTDRLTITIRQTSHIVPTNKLPAA